jgi:hypothetical protein
MSPDTSSSDEREQVVNSSSQPDYSAVDLPSKDRSEYGYVSRRAELLQLIEEVGEPRQLNQTELAERYDVSQQQISKDFDRLATHVHERLIDRDRRAFVVDNVVRRSIQGLLDEEEWHKAGQMAMDYDDWITEFHDLDQLHERMDMMERARDLD